MFPIIPLTVHNVLDYVVGVSLILCPTFFGFSEVAIARDVFFTLGFGLIIYSLFTRYRYSMAKIIPVRVHMTLDALAGLILIFSPWFFDYRSAITDGQSTLHTTMGLAAIGLAILTGPSKVRRSIDVFEDQALYESAA